MRKLPPFVLALVLAVVVVLSFGSSAMAAESPFGAKTAGNYTDQLVVLPDGSNNVVFGVENKAGEVQSTGWVILTRPKLAKPLTAHFYADAQGITRGRLAPGSYVVYFGFVQGETAAQAELSGWIEVEPGQGQVILHLDPAEQSRVELVGGIIYLMF